jgi:hypothetical protein
MKTKVTLAILLLLSLGLNGYLGAKLYKAHICNKAFVLWFYYQQNITINLDALYVDALK